MIRLIDLIKDNSTRDKSEPGQTWPLQVIQDTLAASEQIAIRTLRIDRANKLLEGEGPLSVALKKQFGDQSGMIAAFREISESLNHGLEDLNDNKHNLKEIFATFENIDNITKTNALKHWSIYPGYTSPLLMLLRQSNTFSLWETIWCLDRCYRVRENAPNIEVFSLNYSQPLGDDWYLTECTVEVGNLLVIGGPFWRPLPAEASQDQTLKRTEETLSRLVEIGAIVCDEIGPRSFDRCRRVAAQRAQISEMDAIERTGYINQAFSDVLATCIPSGLKLSSGLVEALTLNALLQRRHQRLFRSENSTAEPVIISTKLPDLDIDGEEETKTPEQESQGFHICYRKIIDGAWLLERSEIVSKLDGANQIVIPTESDGEHCYLDRERSNIFYKMRDAFLTARNAYYLERLMLMRLWIQAEFSEVDLGVELWPNKVRSMLDSVAQTICHMMSASAANIYYYDSLERHLDRLGSFYRNPELDESLDGASTAMKNAGNIQINRAKSVCYRCIDYDKDFIFLRNAQDDQILLTGADTPRCVLVLPIRHNGRVLGILEIKGQKPYELSGETVRWGRETVRLLGPHMYMVLLRHCLHMMAKAVIGTNTEREKQLEEVTRYLTRLFMASSAALHLPGEWNGNSFDCAASINRPELKEAKGVFELNDKISISAKAISKGDEGWEVGLIGKGDLGAPWSEREKIKRLSQLGHKAIAIFAIFRTGGFPLGCVTLTSIDPQVFPEDWKNIGPYIFRQFALMVESIEGEWAKNIKMRQYMAHSLKGRLNRVEGAIEQFERILAPLLEKNERRNAVIEFLDDIEIKSTNLRSSSLKIANTLREAFSRDNRGKLNLSFEDFRNHASDLKVSALYISGGKNMENPAEADPETWSGTLPTLRISLLEAVKPISNIPAKKSLVLPPRSVLDYSVKIRMPTIFFVEILNNIAENAIKYNIGELAPICMYFTPTNESFVYLTFKNQCYPPEINERDKLGSMNFRAKYAEDIDKSGAGVGLAHSKTIARVWNMDIIYSFGATHSSSGKKFKLIDHVIKLKIPKSSLREDAREKR